MIIERFRLRCHDTPQWSWTSTRRATRSRAVEAETSAHEHQGYLIRQIVVDWRSDTCRIGHLTAGMCDWPGQSVVSDCLMRTSSAFEGKRHAR